VYFSFRWRMLHHPSITLWCYVALLPPRFSRSCWSHLETTASRFDVRTKQRPRRSHQCARELLCERVDSCLEASARLSRAANVYCRRTPGNSGKLKVQAGQAPAHFGTGSGSIGHVEVRSDSPRTCPLSVSFMSCASIRSCVVCGEAWCGGQ